MNFPAFIAMFLSAIALIVAGVLVQEWWLWRRGG
jgi:hypothetical protein